MKVYEKLPLVSSDTAAVDLELDQRLKRSSDEGALDWKAMCSPDKRTSATEKRWVYNNVLRLYEEGKCETDIIEAE